MMWCRSKKHVERAEALRAVLQEEEGYKEDADEAEAEPDGTATEPPAASTAAPSESPLEGSKARLASELAQSTEDSASVTEEYVVVSAEQADSSSQDVQILEEAADGEDTDGSAEGELEHSEMDPSQPSDSGEDCNSEETESSEDLDEDEMLARMLRAHAQVKRGAQTCRKKCPQPKADQNGTDQHDSEASVAPATVDADEHASAHRDDAAKDSDWVKAEEVVADLDHHAEQEPSIAPEQPAAAKPTGPAGKADKARSRKDRRKAKEAEAMQNGLLCMVCREHFNTRNQLFKHIKDCGHAQLK